MTRLALRPLALLALVASLALPGAAFADVTDLSPVPPEVADEIAYIVELQEHIKSLSTKVVGMEDDVAAMEADMDDAQEAFDRLQHRADLINSWMDRRIRAYRGLLWQYRNLRAQGNPKAWRVAIRALRVKRMIESVKPRQAEANRRAKRAEQRLDRVADQLDEMYEDLDKALDKLGALKRELAEMIALVERELGLD